MGLTRMALPGQRLGVDKSLFPLLLLLLPQLLPLQLLFLLIGAVTFDRDLDPDEDLGSSY